MARYVTLILFMLAGTLSRCQIQLHTIQMQDLPKYISVQSDMYENQFISKIDRMELQNCGDMHVINLNDMNLEVIKNDIVKSNAIERISLENNHLANVPNNILDYVPRLRCLNLRRNRINLYNTILMRHSYLQVLDLSDQQIFSKQSLVNPQWELDNSAEETENIYKYMVFNSSGMSLPNLKYLDLSRNDMSALSNDFNVSFPRLTHLYLINIYADSIEPNFFNKIPSSLRVLHLENNHFHNLSLNNLMDITTVYLDGNTKLRHVDISSLQLRILSLSNCFTELAYFNLQAPQLEQLDLTKNNLYSMSDFRMQNFQMLQILLLDDNKFSEIPFLNLQQLAQLSLNYNAIKRISLDKIMYLTSLKKLSLKGNNIEDINSDVFKSLKNLEYLDLSVNKLKTLPYNWLLPMTSLQYLNMNSNEFRNISNLGIRYPTEQGNALKHLFVKANMFSKVSTMDLKNLPPYITVYLA